ncbi:terminase small subunit-like protein [Staphylococcus auricularis]|uniref:P27 family phage terminase small subunit n=1 Tax=Staphylococcus auricularis TaxID=29379 RepID=UPI001BCF897C|nr:P27 family phage terminase small subunit [Staphylococcus auricularis]
MNRDGNELRNYLESQLDMDNQVNVEKVDRYIQLVEVFRELRKAIDEHGYIVKTENASQTFLKPNPALSELNKVSNSINALEKSFKLDQPENDKPKKRDLLNG